MNTNLWINVHDFDLDNPPSEYSFSTRLAKENHWTIQFTEAAILEYKKFMYLAAMSDNMVSPSEIIDVVWHQHLIFSQSYSKFCQILGKRIEHVPSTHNRNEFEKFKQAKERTRNLYNQTFGEAPSHIWDNRDIYESLQLPKAKYKTRTFIIVGILLSLFLLFPAYLLLKSTYAAINSPLFFSIYVSTIAVAIFALEVYNTTSLTKWINSRDKSAFIFHLLPEEVIYLKSGLIHAIHVIVNRMVAQQKLQVSDDLLIAKNDLPPNSSAEYTVLQIIPDNGKLAYYQLHKFVSLKPAFKTIEESLDGLKKYFTKSIFFNRLFLINFSILAFLFILGAVRFCTGIVREKPVLFIALDLVAFLIFIIFYLNRLTRIMTQKILPQFYKADMRINQKQPVDEWKYLLHGKYALVGTFIPLVNHYENHAQRAAPSSDSASCGSNCSSGCGSSCGGCGGCGD